MLVVKYANYKTTASNSTALTSVRISVVTLQVMSEKYFSYIYIKCNIMTTIVQ